MSASPGGSVERGKIAARSNLLTSPALAAAGLVASVTVVRALAPEDYAIYAVVLAFRGTVQFAGDFGTGAAATRLFAELQARGAARQAKLAYARLFAVRLAIGAVFVLGVTVAPSVLVDALKLQPDERFVLPLIAVIGLSEVTSSLGYYVLAGTLSHRWINRVVLSTTTLQPLLVIVAAAAGLGLSGIVIGLLVGSLARTFGFHAGALVTLSRIGADGVAAPGMARTYVRTASGSIAGKVAAWVHSRQLVTILAISAVDRVQVAAFALAYDLVHQVFGALSTPFYSLLLPMQSAMSDDKEKERQIFETAIRLLALVVLPTAALLLPLFPPLVSLLFGHDYGDAAKFGAVFIAAYAVEVVLTGPATALMLANDALIRPYREVKLLTTACAVVYFALTGTSLILVGVVMMTVRLVSAFALTVFIRRELGYSGAGPWIRPLLVASAGIAAAAAAARAIAPNEAVAVAGGVVLATLAGVHLFRRGGLIQARDLRLVGDVTPRGAAALRLLVSSRPSSPGNPHEGQVT